MLIFKSIIKQLCIFLLISLGLLMKYKKIEKITLLFAFFIFTYLAAMVVIYTLSPHDLSWHLNTSIKSTMLPIKVCIFFHVNLLAAFIKNFKKKLILIDDRLFKYEK
jgi:hypothetical protein